MSAIQGSGGSLTANSSLEILQGRGAELSRDDQLRQAAEAFETIFLQRLFSEMRKSSEMLGEKKDMGADFYTGMLDQAVAESASQHDGFGIRNVLLRSWGIDPNAPAEATTNALGSSDAVAETDAPARRARRRRPEAPSNDGAMVAAIALPSDQRVGLERWQRPVSAVQDAPAGWDPSRDLRGIRIWTEAGEPVRASGPGRVVGVFHEAAHGQTVEVEHPDGWTTRYGGVENVSVEVGQWVDDRVQLAEVKRDRDAPYLHFEVRRGAAQFNPTVVVPALRGVN